MSVPNCTSAVLEMAVKPARTRLAGLCMALFASLLMVGLTPATAQPLRSGGVFLDEDSFDELDGAPAYDLPGWTSDADGKVVRMEWPRLPADCASCQIQADKVNELGETLFEYRYLIAQQRAFLDSLRTEALAGGEAIEGIIRANMGQIGVLEGLEQKTYAELLAEFHALEGCESYVCNWSILEQDNAETPLTPLDFGWTAENSLGETQETSSRPTFAEALPDWPQGVDETFFPRDPPRDDYCVDETGRFREILAGEEAKEQRARDALRRLERYRQDYQAVIDQYEAMSDLSAQERADIGKAKDYLAGHVAPRLRQIAVGVGVIEDGNAWLRGMIRDQATQPDRNCDRPLDISGKPVETLNSPALISDADWQLIRSFTPVRPTFPEVAATDITVPDVPEDNPCVDMSEQYAALIFAIKGEIIEANTVLEALGTYIREYDEALKAFFGSRNVQIPAAEAVRFENETDSVAWRKYEVSEKLRQLTDLLAELEARQQQPTPETCSGDGNEWGVLGFDEIGAPSESVLEDLNASLLTDLPGWEDTPFGPDRRFWPTHDFQCNACAEAAFEVNEAGTALMDARYEKALAQYKLNQFRQDLREAGNPAPETFADGPGKALQDEIAGLQYREDMTLRRLELALEALILCEKRYDPCGDDGEPETPPLTGLVWDANAIRLTTSDCPICASIVEQINELERQMADLRAEQRREYIRCKPAYDTVDRITGDSEYIQMVYHGASEEARACDEKLSRYSHAAAGLADQLSQLREELSACEAGCPMDQDGSGPGVILPPVNPFLPAATECNACTGQVDLVNGADNQSAWLAAMANLRECERVCRFVDVEIDESFEVAGINFLDPVSLEDHFIRMPQADPVDPVDPSTPLSLSYTGTFDFYHQIGVSDCPTPAGDVLVTSNNGNELEIIFLAPGSQLPGGQIEVFGTGGVAPELSAEFTCEVSDEGMFSDVITVDMLDTITGETGSLSIPITGQVDPAPEPELPPLAVDYTGQFTFFHQVSVTDCPTPAGSITISSNNDNPLELSSIMQSGLPDGQVAFTGMNGVNPTVDAAFTCQVDTDGTYSGTTEIQVLDTVTGEVVTLTVPVTGEVLPPPIVDPEDPPLGVTFTGSFEFFHEVGTTSCPTPAGEVIFSSNNNHPLSINSATPDGLPPDQLDIFTTDGVNPIVRAEFNCQNETGGIFSGTMNVVISDDETGETEVILIPIVGEVVEPPADPLGVTFTGTFEFFHEVGTTSCPTPAGSVTFSSNNNNPLNIVSIDPSGFPPGQLGFTSTNGVNPTVEAEFTCTETGGGIFNGDTIVVIEDTVTNETETISVPTSGEVSVPPLILFSSGEFLITHEIGTTPCPQDGGSVTINASSSSIRVTDTSISGLPSNQVLVFTGEAGDTVTVDVEFTCDVLTEGTFTGTIEVEVTDTNTGEVATVSIPITVIVSAPVVPLELTSTGTFSWFHIVGGSSCPQSAGSVLITPNTGDPLSLVDLSITDPDLNNVFDVDVFPGSPMELSGRFNCFSAENRPYSGDVDLTVMTPDGQEATILIPVSGEVTGP